MNQPKQTTPKNPRSGGGNCWDCLGFGAIFSEFPALLVVGVLFGIFFLVYWLGKKVWEHAPAWGNSLYRPAAPRNALIFLGAAFGLGLLTLDFVPVHTLTLDTVRLLLCIAGAGMALWVRHFLSRPTSG